VRPTRTQQLKKPIKLYQPEIPEEIQDKRGLADRILKKKQQERRKNKKRSRYKKKPYWSCNIESTTHIVYTDLIPLLRHQANTVVVVLQALKAILEVKVTVA
jgi:predicted GNAT family acetyltransferase